MSDIEKTVVAIQGNSVKREILDSDQNGYVLTWVNENDEWEAQPLPTPSTDVAGGDLSETYPNPKVVSLTGNDGSVTFSKLTTSEGHPFISASSDASIGLILSTDNILGGGNGQIIIRSGSLPESPSAGASNVLIDSGHQNGGPQASIYLVTGYDGIDNAQEIALDSLNASIQTNEAQICITPQNVRFNSSGLCLSNIITVTSTYTVNNGRTNAFDYTILGDTTSTGFTISLPPSPLVGETYILKDNGNGATNNLTISGNGVNIDGSATYVINTNYGGITVVFNGSIWSITSKI